MRTRRRTPWAVLTLLALASVTTGCLGIVLPPARVTLAMGAASGSFRASDGSPQPVAAASTVTVRGSLNPLQGFEGLRNRPVDVGFGYAADFARTTATTTRIVHGPYVEIGGFPFHGDAAAGRWRLGFHLSADVPMVDDAAGRRIGIGATASSTLEILGFAAHSGSGSDGTGGGFAAGAGAAHGEGGVGVQAFSSVRSVDGEVYWVVGIGLSARIPALAAFGLFIPYPNFH